MRHLISTALAFLFWFAVVSSAFAQENADLKPLLAYEATLQQIIKRAEPAIACILVSRSDAYRARVPEPPANDKAQLGPFRRGRAAPGPFDGARDREKPDKDNLANPKVIPESFGSGVAIDKEGRILTCYHVVRDAAKIYVRFPGGKGSYAEIHAADARSDLAVLRLHDESAAPARFLKFGDGGNVQTGRMVISIANLFAAGFRDGTPVASWGIVSGVRQRAVIGSDDPNTSLKMLYQHRVLLQTDVRLNVGCSGGALIDLKGDLIGLTTALAALSGSETPGGFAVPMDATTQRIIGKLREGKEVEYGFLGVNVKTQTGFSGDGIGIEEVTAGSPAFNAGLQHGDRLLSVGGYILKEPDDLFLAVGVQLADSEVKIEVAGSGGVRPVTVRLAKFYLPPDKFKNVVSNPSPAPRGLRVEHASVLIQKQPTFGGRGLQRTRHIPEGVLIREVIPDSPADKAKLQPDKIITRVAGRAVLTPDAFYREFEKNTGPVTLMLLDSDGIESPVRLEAR